VRRLAFANARTRLMTTAQYDVYARAREASFTGGRRGRLARDFAALLPRPALSRATVEVLAFCAYDRAGAVVEAAVRARAAAARSAGAGGGSGAGARAAARPPPREDAPLVADAALLEQPLTPGDYAAALRALPPEPPELAELLGEMSERARHAAEARQLKVARELQRAREAAEAAAAPAVAPGAAAVHDAEGDAAFLASMLGAS